MADKDFLSQFSENNKPASFKEEERIPVANTNKKFNPKFLIIGIIALLIVAAILFIIFFLPKIKVQDFTGMKKEDAVAWIRQQGIETSGIIFKEEYDFGNDKGVILSQDPKNGKVSKDAKMTFVVSRGPDPDEKVAVPDFSTMDREQINYWIKDNKLLSTKINTTYSDTVDADQFIKADYTGCDEESFTRGCSLKISISKGAKPAETITMIDFTNKYYQEAETWGKNNKITVKKVESYSEKIAKDYIISQSIEPKKEVKEGDTLTVYVSLGKAVVAPNVVGMDINKAIRVASEEGLSLYQEERYNSGYAKGVVISQGVSAGTIIDGTVMDVIVSLGDPVLPKPINSFTYDELKAWIEEVNSKGANINKGQKSWENSDDVEYGYVIRTNSIECGSTLNPVVSSGRNIWLEPIYVDSSTGNTYSWSDALTYNEKDIRILCELSGVNYEVVYDTSSTVEPNYVISVKRDCGEADVIANNYISQSNIVTVTICERKS